MNPVSIVTIKAKLPLYKKEEPANSIEIILLEEVGFELVSQKDLYSVGDKAIYIQPDFCVPDTPLFGSFIRPNGDESKSMLGKINGEPRRIRAKKFTLSKEPNGDPVYSNGILLPLIEVINYLDHPHRSNADFALDEQDWTKLLGITKYEAPEDLGQGGLKSGQREGSFPSGVYRTDEENINNLWKRIKYPITLVGSEKIDGSSITIGITNTLPDGFIASRNFTKKLLIKRVKGRREKTSFEKLLFWTKPDLNIYEEIPSDDDFVVNGLPYLEEIKKYYTNIILRGELNGSRLKGSDNKNNPASKEPINIKFFGIDVVNDNGVAEKVSHDVFVEETRRLNFPTVKTIFIKEFNSKEEIEKECNEYFKANMIEGIVLRTLDSKFSAKLMNLEYDSKK